MGGVGIHSFFFEKYFYTVPECQFQILPCLDLVVQLNAV